MARAYIVKLQEHARNRESHEFMHQLGGRLFKRPLPLSEEDLIWLASQSARARDFWEWPLAGVADAVERHAKQHGLSKDLRRAVERMIKNVERIAWHKSERAIVPRLAKLVRDSAETFTVDAGEPWAKRVHADVIAMKKGQRQRWNALLVHAQKSTASKPSPEWLKRVRTLVRAVGVDRFAERIAVWFTLFKRRRTDRPCKDFPQSLRRDWGNACSIPNCLLLKGLIWCCWAVPDRRNRAVLESLMSDCYRQSPLGKRFAEGGTACKRALEAIR